MNVFNIISALTMVSCAVALVIFISWEMGVVYTALCMVSYIALSQIAEDRIHARLKSLTEGKRDCALSAADIADFRARRKLRRR